MIKYVLFTLPAILFVTTCFSQLINQGWLFLSHTQKLSKRWDGLADVQFRSSDELVHIHTALLRGAISYNINDKHAFAIGYAYKADWEEGTDKLDYQCENRIYQQYLYNGTLKRTELTVRVRLEQRFVKEMEVSEFSQRLRSFLSFQIPLFANNHFSKGLYTGMQNELFVNVQHKEKVNNRFFDQNRSSISLGYRWSKKIDTEIGYMYWYHKEKDEIAKKNVVQVMFTTQL